MLQKIADIHRDKQLALSLNQEADCEVLVPDVLYPSGN